MDTIRLSKALWDSTYGVEILLGHDQGAYERISSGSAVAINDKGDLLTAAHVVAGRIPIREDDLNDPRIVILARYASQGYCSYKFAATVPQFQFPPYLRKPLTVDLALLRAEEKQHGTAHLSIAEESPLLGTPVLMAGYPDDIELPLELDRVLNYANKEVQSQRAGLEMVRRQFMVRSGIIGNRNEVQFWDARSQRHFSGHVFVVDNVLHAGGSGGPVIDETGRIVGILTQRAMTAVPYEETPSLRVPSGAAIALTPSFILPILQDHGAV